MDPVDKEAQQLRDTLKGCFEQIRFARAAELARSGCYLQAEGLLSPNGRESSDPKELDLLARIAAQQRQYGLARRRWDAALQQSPDNADYKRAIERTMEVEHFQMILRKWAIVALVVFSVAVLIISVWNSSHLTQDSQSPPQNSNSTETTPKQIDPTTIQPATKLPQVATPPSAPSPIEGTLAVPQPTPIAPQPTPATPEPATPHPVTPTTIPPKAPSTTIIPVAPPPTIPHPNPAIPQPTPTAPEPEPVAPEPTPAAPQPLPPTFLENASATQQPESSPWLQRTNEG